MALTLPSLLSLKTTAISAGIAFVVGSGLGGWGGYKLGHAAYDHEVRREAQAAVQGQHVVTNLQAAGAGIAQVASNSREAAQARVLTNTITLTREVPHYVTVHDAAQCGPLPVGLLQLHDAAAANDPARLSGSPGGLVPGAPILHVPPPVGLDSFASAIVTNYGVAYQWRAELLAWRDWYTRERAAWEAVRGSPATTTSTTR